MVKALQKRGIDSHNTPASGAKWFAKSDAVADEYLQIELKTVVKPAESFSVKRLWLDKVKEESFSTGRVPVLGFSFGYGSNYYVINALDLAGWIQECQRHFEFTFKEVPPPHGKKSIMIYKSDLDHVKQYSLTMQGVPVLTFNWNNDRFIVLEDCDLYDIIMEVKSIRDGQA